MDKITIRELKSNAKEQLLGNYGVLGGATLVSSMILLSLSMLISSATPEGDIGKAVSAVGQLIIVFVEAILLYGFSGMVLRTVCKMPTSMVELLEGFKATRWSPVVQCELKMFLYTFFCFLPCGIGLGVAFIFQNEIVSACAIGLAVVGVIIFIYISLIYSFRFYCMLDFPGRRGRDYMRLSRDVIKGHTMKLFWIKLSFIPWIIVVLLSLGIASIWVKPYKRATEINYYLFLMSQR